MKTRRQILFSIIFVFFSAESINAQEMAEKSLMDYAILYVDSLLNEGSIILDSGTNKEYVLTKEKSILKYEDTYNCLFPKNHQTREIIDDMFPSDHYAWLRLDEYEPDHMLYRYYAPEDFISLIWCNKMYMLGSEKYIVCHLISRKSYGDEEGGGFHQYSTLLFLYYVDKKIVRHEVAHLCD